MARHVMLQQCKKMLRKEIKLVTNTRRYLEEGTKEFENERKLATKMYSRSEMREEGLLSPQYYQTTTDDNYQKTTATFLKEDMDKSYTFLMGVSNLGFRLGDGTALLGPIAAFPKLVLSWMVNSVDDISGESIEFLTMLEPKLDVVLIGVGEPENVERIRKRLGVYLQQTKLRAEILSSVDACSTFNYLNADGRAVAALMYPPDRIPEPTESDKFHFGRLHDDQMITPLPIREMFGLPPKNKGTSVPITAGTPPKSSVKKT